MACNGDDTELEGKINHWCNVSGESLQRKANARGSIYCLIAWTSRWVFWQCSSWLTSALLPAPEMWLPDSAMRPCNLCLWIMDIPSKWRPIYVLYYAPLHLFWLGLWLDSWRFYWWWTPWFIRSSQAGPSIKTPRQDGHSGCTVTCCLWLTDCASTSSAHHCDYSGTRGSKVMCITQFVPPLNRQHLFSSFIKTQTSFYPIIRITITVNCEAVLYIALFYSLIL